MSCNCRPKVIDLSDVVNHPAHYTRGQIETIEIIEALDLPYHLSAVVKYLARYRYKGKPLEDLRKARWYLDRFIDHGNWNDKP